MYDPEYYEWMKIAHPAEAEAWIKSVEQPISSTGQAPESETTEKSCETPGPSKPSEQYKYISR